MTNCGKIHIIEKTNVEQLFYGLNYSRKNALRAKRPDRLIVYVC